MGSDYFPLFVYQWIAALMAFLSAIAFLLNSCVILIFFGNRSLLTSSNYLLLSMAFSDWLRSVFVAPVGAYANAKHWWTLDSWVCQYFAFSSTLLGLTSVVHLVALAVERCVTISMALAQEISKAKMAVVIVGLWSFSLVWSIFPLLGWSSFGPEPGFAGCSVVWNSHSASDKAYIFCLLILFFVVPIVIATFCYIRIYKDVHKLAFNAARRWGIVARPTLETVQAKTKTTKMSLTMATSFLVAWSPYAVVSMYSSFSTRKVDPLPATLPALFAKFSVCCNPVIYFFMYRKFRVAAKNMLLPRKLIASQLTSALDNRPQRIFGSSISKI